MSSRRSEHLLRLVRVGPGRFVCDQREVGGKLWHAQRLRRDEWEIAANGEEPAAVPGSELRRFLAARAAEALTEPEP